MITRKQLVEALVQGGNIPDYSCGMDVELEMCLENVEDRFEDLYLALGQLSNDFLEEWDCTITEWYKMKNHG